MASPEFVQDAACLQTFSEPLRIYVSIPEAPRALSLFCGVRKNYPKTVRVTLCRRSY